MLGTLSGSSAPNFGTTTTQINIVQARGLCLYSLFLGLNSENYSIYWSDRFLGLLYGLYILYLGLPIMLGTPQANALTYFIVILVVTFVVYAIISAIIGGITLAAFHFGAGFYGY